ncbi:MAG: ACT domain-containing protein [bacterium]
MPIEKQLSIFVQNKTGILADLCKNFSAANINIKSFSIVDDLDWGILRIIVDDTDASKKILNARGLTYGESHVLSVETRNHPGALAALAEKLAENEINIEQAFATAAGNKSLIVMSTTDDQKANIVLSHD